MREFDYGGRNMAFFETGNLSEVVFVLLTIVAPIAFGAWTVIFNRRFSLLVIREQNAVWGSDFSRYEFFIRVFSVIVGLVLMFAGLAAAAEFLFR